MGLVPHGLLGNDSRVIAAMDPSEAMIRIPSGLFSAHQFLQEADAARQGRVPSGPKGFERSQASDGKAWLALLVCAARACLECAFGRPRQGLRLSGGQPATGGAISPRSLHNS